MAQEIDYEEQLDDIRSDLHQFIEVESLSKLKNCLKSIKKLQEDITVYSDKFTSQKTLLDGELRQQLKLNVTGDHNVDTLEYARGLLSKEKHELQTATDKWDKLRKTKQELVLKFKSASDDFDTKKARSKDLDRQLTELNESAQKSEHRRLSKLMHTVYKMDGQSRCVSLILDAENYLERAVLVDKENKPEAELREEIWSAFEKLYSK